MIFLHMPSHWFSCSILLPFFKMKNCFPICRLLCTFHTEDFIGFLVIKISFLSENSPNNWSRFWRWKRMIVFFAIDDDIQRIRLSLVACIGCSSFCRHNFDLFWCFRLPPLEINLLIPWDGTGAPAGKVRRTLLCAAQCAHFQVRRTVHCAHSMLTLSN